MTEFRLNFLRYFHRKVLVNFICLISVQHNICFRRDYNNYKTLLTVTELKAVLIFLLREETVLISGKELKIQYNFVAKILIYVCLTENKLMK